jgi:hypothetical protein
VLRLTSFARSLRAQMSSRSPSSCDSASYERSHYSLSIHSARSSFAQLLDAGSDNSEIISPVRFVEDDAEVSSGNASEIPALEETNAFRDAIRLCAKKTDTTSTAIQQPNGWRNSPTKMTAEEDDLAQWLDPTRVHAAFSARRMEDQQIMQAQWTERIDGMMAHREASLQKQHQHAITTIQEQAKTLLRNQLAAKDRAIAAWAKEFQATLSKTYEHQLAELRSRLTVAESRSLQMDRMALSLTQDQSQKDAIASRLTDQLQAERSSSEALRVQNRQLTAEMEARDIAATRAQDRIAELQRSNEELEKQVVIAQQAHPAVPSENEDLKAQLASAAQVHSELLARNHSLQQTIESQKVADAEFHALRTVAEERGRSYSDAAQQNQDLHEELEKLVATVEQQTAAAVLQSEEHQKTRAQLAKAEAIIESLRPFPVPNESPAGDLQAMDAHAAAIQQLEDHLATMLAQAEAKALEAEPVEREVVVLKQAVRDLERALALERETVKRASVDEDAADLQLRLELAEQKGRTLESETTAQAHTIQAQASLLAQLQATLEARQQRVSEMSTNTTPSLERVLELVSPAATRRVSEQRKSGQSGSKRSMPVATRLSFNGTSPAAVASQLKVISPVPLRISAQFTSPRASSIYESGMSVEADGDPEFEVQREATPPVHEIEASPSSGVSPAPMNEYPDRTLQVIIDSRTTSTGAKQFLVKFQEFHAEEHFAWVSAERAGEEAMQTFLAKSCALCGHHQGPSVSAPSSSHILSPHVSSLLSPSVASQFFPRSFGHGAKVSQVWVHRSCAALGFCLDEKQGTAKWTLQGVASKVKDAAGIVCASCSNTGAYHTCAHCSTAYHPTCAFAEKCEATGRRHGWKDQPIWIRPTAPAPKHSEIPARSPSISHSSSPSLSRSTSTPHLPRGSPSSKALSLLGLPIPATPKAGVELSRAMEASSVKKSTTSAAGTKQLGARKQSKVAQEDSDEEDEHLREYSRNSISSHSRSRSNEAEGAAAPEPQVARKPSKPGDWLNGQMKQNVTNQPRPQAKSGWQAAFASLSAK